MGKKNSWYGTDIYMVFTTDRLLEVAVKVLKWIFSPDMVTKQVNASSSNEIYEVIIYGIYFWAKVFRFHKESWPEWDSDLVLTVHTL